MDHDTSAPSFRALVALDDSDAATMAVEFVRLLPTTEITLLRVQPQMVWPRPGRAQYRQSNRPADLEAKLEMLAASLRDGGRTVDVSVKHGDVAETIIDTARDYDLVVMPTHGRGAAGRMIFGSVADRVSRFGETPVLLLRRHLQVSSSPATTFQRIVVPLDGSKLAEQVLPMAARLANAFSVPLHLVRTLDPDELRIAATEYQRAEDDPAAPNEDLHDDYEQIRQVVETDYMTKQVTMLRNEGVDAQSHMLHGPPASALLHHLQPEDLAVMTSHGRGGHTRWAMGSVAEKLVRNAEAPVLLIPTRTTSPAQ